MISKIFHYLTFKNTMDIKRNQKEQIKKQEEERRIEKIEKAKDQEKKKKLYGSEFDS
mgnify:CR=1 FL=1